MSVSRYISAFAKSSDGKGRLITLASILVLASLLVLVFAVLPVGAGGGDATTTWTVLPDEHNLGGQANDCSVIQGDLPSAAMYEFRIVTRRPAAIPTPGRAGRRSLWKSSTTKRSTSASPAGPCSTSS